jgi:hypothetical protein
MNAKFGGDLWRMQFAIRVNNLLLDFAQHTTLICANITHKPHHNPKKVKKLFLPLSLVITFHVPFNPIVSSTMVGCPPTSSSIVTVLVIP